jgi:hypothetical protein
MDQGREAGGALDATVVSPVPGERGPAAVERSGLQPRESVAAARATETDRQLVVDQPAAAPRQDWRPLGETRTVLLAPAGREPPVRVDASADLGAPDADRLTDDGGRRPSGRREGVRRERCLRNVAAACSSAGIQVATAGVVRCDRCDKNIRSGKVEQG